MSRLRMILPSSLALCSFALTAHAVPTEPGTLTNGLTAASTCTNCHSFGNLEAAQDDPLYAPWFGWQGSMMANAARDPVFWAGVAIASQDQPGGTTDCVRCHAPRAFIEGRGESIAIDELQPNDLAGVECELCHRTIEDLSVPPGNARYTIDDVVVGAAVPRRGPFSYDDGVGTPPHPYVQDPTIGSSRLCGTCHDVTTNRERVDDDGNGLGVDFGEQRTYSEWQGSVFAQAGDDFRSCQDCHMPAVTDMPACFDNANAGHSHPTGGRRHDLVGANRFMIELLRGEYGSMGSDEIDDFFFDNSIDRLDELIATAATMEASGPADVDLGAGLAGLDITVTNESGHKLPTGYSEGRVMWIEVVASYGDQVVWSSGRWTQGTGFEQDPQLRSYRGVAEELESGDTFHLLRDDHWVEDTRIPPRGLQQSIQTDPVGDRYAPLPDGSWPNYDATSYSFAGDTTVVDATPEQSDDDVLTVDVRLLYVINTPEYVQFLADENQTNAAGDDVLALFEDAGGATPLVLASQQLMIPITAFGSAGESSSSGTTAAADTSGTTAGSSESSPADSSTSAAPGTSDDTTGPAIDDGPSDGCGCTSGTTPGTGWLLVALPMLRRRRRR
jgi:MYXO-CTERM domain-containing protein